MGSMESCEPCITPATGTVVNLSDALVLRLCDEETVPSRIKQKHVIETPDESWFEKIRCLDDTHSRAYGLSFKALSEHIQILDRRLKNLVIKPPCNTVAITNCYKKNPDCIITCAREVNKFLECVDSKRLEKLTIKIEKKRAEERAEQKTRKKYKS